MATDTITTYGAHDARARAVAMRERGSRSVIEEAGTAGPSVKRREAHTSRIVGAILLALLCAYPLSYVVLRKSHALLCTGWYYNLKDRWGNPAPDAGWCEVEISAVAAETKWLETLYWPAIALERVVWVSFKGEPGV